MAAAVGVAGGAAGGSERTSGRPARRDLCDASPHGHAAIVQDKYLPVLLGSLAPFAGNYYGHQPFRCSNLLGEHLLARPRAEVSNATVTTNEDRPITDATPIRDGSLISLTRAHTNDNNDNNDNNNNNDSDANSTTKHIKQRQPSKDNQCNEGNYWPRKPVSQLQERQSIRLVHLILAVALICGHNAASCSGLSSADLSDYISVTGDVDQKQDLTDSIPFTRWFYRPNAYGRRAGAAVRGTKYDEYDGQDTLPFRQWFYRPNLRLKRSTTNDYLHSFYDLLPGANPTGAPMTSGFGSFSQDQAADPASPPGVARRSWTSIFGGSGNSGNDAGQSGGGGDLLDTHVKNILVPRVSGTPGNVQVRQYIVDTLRKNAYHVELDEFTGSTPIGNIRFANIIASSNPGACRQLVLACHYDSKLQEGFLGATDSAVPCAMLLRIAENQSGVVQNSTGPWQAADLGLRFIFFDGEEAFVQWSATDSLYGSRHLAARWANQPAPGRQCGPRKSELDRIDLFVLLDLIGASDTSFVMYNSQLRHHYQALQAHEKEALLGSGLSQAQARRQAAFKSRTMALDFVEDDHVPFKKRGVPILLLLAHPFPRVWHTNEDNYQAIDWPKTRRILHVMEQFVINYPSSKRAT